MPTQIATAIANPTNPLSAVRQSIRGNACAPLQEEDDGGEDDHDLPDGGVKNLEQRRPVRSDEIERDDADLVDELHDHRADRESGEARAPLRGERADRREQDQHRLDAVAAVVDVYGE